MTLHAAWKMDTQGVVRGAAGDLAHQVLRRAGAARRRSTARCRSTARWATRPTCRWRRCTATPARRALLRRPRRGPPPVGRAPDPARLRAAGRRGAERARPDAARGGAAEVRGGARRGHRERLTRWPAGRGVGPPCGSWWSCSSCRSCSGRDRPGRGPRLPDHRRRAAAAPTARRDRAGPARPAAAADGRPLRRRPGVRARARCRSSGSARGRRARRRARLAARLRAPAAAARAATRPCPADGHRLRNVVGTLPGAAPGRRRRRPLRHGRHARGHRRAPTTAPRAPPSSSSSRGRCAHAPRPRERPRGALRALRRRGGARATRDFLRTGLRGSRAYARAHARARSGRSSCSTTSATATCACVREGSSDRALWARLRAAARAVGVGAVFPAGTGARIFDDHTPFLDAGVPAIDLIDWPYRFRHTLQDTVDKTSPRSLDAVGEAVLRLVQELRAPSDRASAAARASYHGRHGRPRSREAPARRAARLLRRRRPRGADGRARARALRRARVRPQGDRPQQARRRAAARARRRLRRGARRRRSPRARSRSSPPTACRPAVHAEAEQRAAADHRRDLPARDQGPPRGREVRRRGLHDRPHRPRRPRGGRGHDGRGARAHRARRDRGGRRRAGGRGPGRSSPTSRRRRCRSTRRARSSPGCASASRQITGPRTDDICYATTNRQAAVKQMAPHCDLVLVIGSRNSSNSNRLVEVAREHGAESYLIDNEGQVEEAWLEGKRVVGITSGASAPEELVQRPGRLLPRPRHRGRRGVPGRPGGRPLHAPQDDPAGHDGRRRLAGRRPASAQRRRAGAPPG